MIRIRIVKQNSLYLLCTLCLSMETDERNSPSTQAEPIDILGSDEEEAKLSYLTQLKHTVIGNKARKLSSLSDLPRIISLALSPSCGDLLLGECLVVLASYCHLSLEARTFFKNRDLPSLFLSQLRGGAASLRTTHYAIYALMSYCTHFPDYLDAELVFREENLLPLTSHLDGALRPSQQVAVILRTTCSSQQHQLRLLGCDVIPRLAARLRSINSVRQPFLDLLARLLEGSPEVAKTVSRFVYPDGTSIPDCLSEMVVKETHAAIKLSASACLVSLFLSCPSPPDKERHGRTLKFKLLPRLVALSRPEADSSFLVQKRAIGILSRAVEGNSELQQVLAITDQFLTVLTDYLKQASEQEGDSKEGEAMDVDVFLESPPELTPEKTALKAVIFQILSLLCAKEEAVRRCVTENKGYVMEQLVRGLLYDNHDIKLSSLNCLLSLSRSVKQQRTSFMDYPAWRHVLKTADPTTQPEDIVMASYSLLANLVLDFSPSKDDLIKADVITKFHSGLQGSNHALTELCYWGLMNATYQAPLPVRKAVRALDSYPQFLFTHFSNPVSQELTLRSLAILRNLLCSDSDIDEFLRVEEESGLEIVFTVTQNQELSEEVREQALCVMGNISSGSTSAKKKVSGHSIDIFFIQLLISTMI